MQVTPFLIMMDFPEDPRCEMQAIRFSVTFLPGGFRVVRASFVSTELKLAHLLPCTLTSPALPLPVPSVPRILEMEQQHSY